MANEAGSFREIPPERRLPFETIREPIDTVLSAMALKLEREWPRKWAGLVGARLYFQGAVQLADFTYQSVRFLCADKPANPARKLEFAISVPPLARTILDSIFTLKETRIFFVEAEDHGGSMWRFGSQIGNIGSVQYFLSSAIPSSPRPRLRWRGRSSCGPGERRNKER